MCGQQLDGAVRQSPHLHAWALQRDPGDPFFDDAAALLERRQKALHRQCFRLWSQTLQAFGDRCRFVRRAGSRQLVQIQRRVARARYALVGFDDRMFDRWPPCTHALHSSHDVIDGVKVLGPDRILHPALLEHAAASGLAAEINEAGIRPVHRNAKGQSDIPLERCGVVRNEVATVRVRDQCPDFPEQPWTRQQLGTQWRR